MVEAIKHLFGFCGEGHPNLLIGIGLTQILLFKNQILYGLRYFILCLKTFLLLFWR